MNPDNPSFRTTDDWEKRCQDLVKENIALRNKIVESEKLYEDLWVITHEDLNKLGPENVKLKRFVEYLWESICHHSGDIREGINRDWCHECSSWVFESDWEMLKELREYIMAVDKNEIRSGEKKKCSED